MSCSHTSSFPKSITIWEGDPGAMHFVPIPRGDFLMGSRGYSWEEEPRHQVRIAGPENQSGLPAFWMGRTPVTQAQFARWTNRDDYRDWHLSVGSQHKLSEEHANYFAGHPACPAEQVSWWEAMGFCEWLVGKMAFPLGFRASLPSEAQWEYACRAGTGTEYYSGNGEAALADAGWFDGNSGDTTHPVGELAANAWGLFDMHGNVWEWCRDAWDQAAYRSRLAGVENPLTKLTVDPGLVSRVRRGGSWGDHSWGCRFAYRDRNRPSSRDFSCGFRVCLIRGAILPGRERGAFHETKAEDGGGDARGVGTPPDSRQSQPQRPPIGG